MATDLGEIRRLAGLERRELEEEPIKYGGREYSSPVEEVKITIELKLARHAFGWGASGTARVVGTTVKGTAIDETVKVPAGANKNQHDAISTAFYELRNSVPKMFPKQKV